MIRLTFLLALCTTAFAASLNPGLIPNDRQWVAHLDLRVLYAGRIGAYIQERCNDPEIDLKLRQFTFLTGVNPATDIDQITIAGIDEDSSHVILWIHGRFDGTRLTELVGLADEHRAIGYRGHTIHTWVDRNQGNKPQAGCLIKDGLLLFGEQAAALQAAIDVLDGKGQGLTAQDALHQALPNLDAPFLIAAAAGGDGWKGKTAKSAFVQQLNSIGFSASEGNDQLVLSAQAVTRDADTATRLRDLGQGLLALSSFNQEVLAFPVAAEALKSATLSATGTTLNANMSCSIATLEAAANKVLPK